jgi:hypothetical protein
MKKFAENHRESCSTSHYVYKLSFDSFRKSANLLFDCNYLLEYAELRRALRTFSESPRFDFASCTRSPFAVAVSIGVVVRVCIVSDIKLENKGEIQIRNYLRDDENSISENL